MAFVGRNFEIKTFPSKTQLQTKAVSTVHRKKYSPSPTSSSIKQTDIVTRAKNC